MYGQCEKRWKWRTPDSIWDPFQLQISKWPSFQSMINHLPRCLSTFGKQSHQSVELPLQTIAFAFFRMSSFKKQWRFFGWFFSWWIFSMTCWNWNMAEDYFPSVSTSIQVASGNFTHLLDVFPVVKTSISISFLEVFNIVAAIFHSPNLWALKNCSSRWFPIVFDDLNLRCSSSLYQSFSLRSQLSGRQIPPIFTIFR